MPSRPFVPRPDTAWTGSGTAFGRAAAKRRCTLLAVWYVEQEEPWIILTDLPPDQVGVSWYALRFWIELGFKPALGSDRGAVKSLGWQWQKTRRTDPARISGHWFVLSVATLLTLAYGTRVEEAYDRRMTPGSLQAPPKALAPTHRSSREKPGRHHMAEAVAASGPVLEPGLAAARTQVQPGGYPPCSCMNTPYIPLSAGRGLG